MHAQITASTTSTITPFANYVPIVEEQTGLWVLSGNGHGNADHSGAYHGRFVTAGGVSYNLQLATLGVLENMSRALSTKKLEPSHLNRLIVYLTPHASESTVSTILTQYFATLTPDITYRQVSELPGENIIEIEGTACTDMTALEVHFPEYSYSSSLHDVSQAVFDVFKNLNNQLKQDSLRLENVSHVTLTLQTKAQYAAMNAAWNAIFIDQNSTPTHTCVFIASSAATVSIDVRTSHSSISRVDATILQ